MATLREIRGRIVGVKKTQKITRAMKMVAAAKLRRAQRNVGAARPYATKMRELLRFLMTSADLSDNVFVKEREVRSVALVIVTADRGFCGGFNSNLIKFALNHAATKYPDVQKNGGVKIFCVGKKGADIFTKRGFHIVAKYVGLFSKLAFSQAQMIVREIIDGYMKERFDRVEIISNEFKSVSQQHIVVQQFLPIPRQETLETKPDIDYIFEPSRFKILESLLPRHLNFQVWQVLLESSAAEEGARMVAMENATENASELISTLELQYNKARQAAITKELLEVVSGAEALKKAG
jgi:F-type H+-transporting ATPase subunit gamma